MPGETWLQGRGGLERLRVTQPGFEVVAPERLHGVSHPPRPSSLPSSWAGTGFLMKVENLWKMSLPARLDSLYCGTRLGNLQGHGCS